MGKHDQHLPRRNDNRGIHPNSPGVSARERKDIAAKQGRGTKDDAKAARARKR
jgi:hypothetical protein